MKLFPTTYEIMKERFLDLLDLYRAKEVEKAKLDELHTKYIWEDETEVTVMVANRRKALITEMAAIDRSLEKMRENFFTPEQLKEMKKEYQSKSPAGA